MHHSIPSDKNAKQQQETNQNQKNSQSNFIKNNTIKEPNRRD
jgi:hypothetical protein